MITIGWTIDIESLVTSISKQMMIKKGGGGATKTWNGALRSQFFFSATCLVLVPVLFFSVSTVWVRVFVSDRSTFVPPSSPTANSMLPQNGPHKTDFKRLLIVYWLRHCRQQIYTHFFFLLCPSSSPRAWLTAAQWLTRFALRNKYAWIRIKAMSAPVSFKRTNTHTHTQNEKRLQRRQRRQKSIVLFFPSQQLNDCSVCFTCSSFASLNCLMECIDGNLFRSCASDRALPNKQTKIRMNRGGAGGFG